MTTGMVVVARFRAAIWRLPPAQEHVRVEPHQVGGEFGQPVIVERGVATVDHEIPSLHVAQLAESVCEGDGHG